MKKINYDVHDYKFINLYSNYKTMPIEVLKKQYKKFNEELSELIIEDSENVLSEEFQNELLDVICSGLNLYEALRLYTGDNGYERHINKINKRLKDFDYDWKIELKGGKND